MNARAGVVSIFAVVLAAVAAWVFFHRLSVPPGARIDPRDPAQLARGRVVYEERCAVCHGRQLEGQPDWRMRLPNGRMPAPPHDDTGHTWHHADEVLIAIIRNGLVPPHAPAGYESDMPEFGPVLSDEDIRAVLAYIESHWSDDVVKVRNEMLRQKHSQ